ncbi:MAG: hypothetical protein Ct9H300mP12_13270 [Acidimicrobiales bacterium]|nr:MAG: hypothetical protein Ct9H300mP12_13270 [Acidimicrobiales bacterium]
MIEMDPPDHTVFRKLVSRVFTVLRMAEMEDDVRRIVAGYVDAVIEVARPTWSPTSPHLFRWMSSPPC